MNQQAPSGATEPVQAPTQHDAEPHDRGAFNDGLNKLRAGVLGANDGIVSVAAVVVGVAGATTELAPIITAGVAAVVGGAISMALGEYVSVASARDSQTALIAKEKRELAEMPEQELAELAGIYQAKGLSPETAQRVAEELTAHDALGAHLEAELHIDENEVLKPWQAAWASFLAFLLGAVLPMLAISLPPADLRIPIAFVATLLALGITGGLGAYLGKSPWLKPTVRVVLGGAVALAVTFAIGALLGTAIA
jgi:VIT1/CCC1 family predicted Fe2+/Mn2+ transporter